MRFLAAALLLATTVATSAQIVGPERTYGPYARPLFDNDGPALAIGRRGILLAWSEIENSQAQIRMAMLDRNAHLVSSIVTLPATGATVPAVSTDGTSFFLAYLKDNGTWGLPIDAAGQPNGTPRRYGSSPMSKPPLVWDGTSYLLWTADEVIAIAPDGSIRFRAVTEPPEAVAADGEIAFAWRKKIETKIPGRCPWPPGMCAPIGTRVTYDISWAVGGDRAGTEVVGDTLVSPPAIASSDGDVVIAWTLSKELMYLVVGHELVGVPADVDGNVPTGLACSGGECLIAYGTQSGDVHALLFSTGDFTLVDLLPIATSERRETTPRVLAIGPGRFLVTYLSDASDKRFAGRIVTLDPSKRRSVR